MLRNCVVILNDKIMENQTGRMHLAGIAGWSAWWNKFEKKNLPDQGDVLFQNAILSRNRNKSFMTPNKELWSTNMDTEFKFFSL
jgi:hypothetical protein